MGRERALYSSAIPGTRVLPIADASRLPVVLLQFSAEHQRSGGGAGPRPRAATHQPRASAQQAASSPTAPKATPESRRGSPHRHEQPGLPHNNWDKSRTLNNRLDHLGGGPGPDRGSELVCGPGPVVWRAFLRLALVCPGALTPGGSLEVRVPPGRILLGRLSPRGPTVVRWRSGLLCATGERSCGLDGAPEAGGCGLAGPGGQDRAR
ncbi:hypothetical protein NDU88_004928 [Pleurodeles waltl]|uniref:Uncharacterized protein n=1 Tax=Pleurodeles waltl TaxID=8319 RepID=A0AAV7PGK1_PLEWA|nr:hypothetical protein NDU88_004928 [Pleurodeles waltl]